MKTNARRMLRLAAAVAIVGFGLAFATPAQAQWGVVIHPSSVHLHRTYYPTYSYPSYSHFTHQRILYTNGFYHHTPHFTTGHTYRHPHHGHTHRHPHFR